jgi:hypothetical protein
MINPGLLPDMADFECREIKRILFHSDDKMQRALIVLGAVMVVAGLAWPWLSKLPFGRLPGDIHIVREGFSFHFPIVTCLVISVLLSLLIWFFRR